MVCSIFSDRQEVNGYYQNEHENDIVNIKIKILNKIWQMFCNGYNEFIVNCEYGIPLWAAEIVIALKLYNNIKLDIIVPYEEQCRNWSEDSRNRYYECHKNADTVKMMNTNYSKECYRASEEFMVSMSNVVLSFGFSNRINYFADIFNVPVIYVN